jgi:hypothetical protein
MNGGDFDQKTCFLNFIRGSIGSLLASLASKNRKKSLEIGAIAPSAPSKFITDSHPLSSKSEQEK